MSSPLNRPAAPMFFGVVRRSQAYLDRPGRAIRQKHRPGGQVRGKPQDVRGVRSGRLKPSSVALGHRLCDLLGGRL